GCGAACAPSISTVECRRVAAGRGSTYAPSIRPVEPGLLSGSCLVDRQAGEGHGQNREQHDPSLCPAHPVHACLLMGTASVPTEVLCPLVAVPPVQDLLLCAKHLLVAAIADAMRLACSNAILRRRCGRKRLSPDGNKPRPGAGGRAWPVPGPK